MIHLKLHTAKGTRNINMPEQWEELNEEQLSLVAKNLFTPVPLNELEIRLVVILSGMNPKELRKTQVDVMYEHLVPLVQWVIESCTLTKQLIPVIRNRFGRNFYGPSTELDNVRLGEFDSAEKALYDFNEAPENLELLYTFIACIYRPGKFFFKEGDSSSDRRHPFDHTKVFCYSKKLRKILPLHKAYGIFLWYKGCRQKIHQDYKVLFEGSSEEEAGAPDYFPVMRMIAKENIYGDFDKVEQLLLYTALHELYCVYEEKKEAERIAKESNK